MYANEELPKILGRRWDRCQTAADRCPSGRKTIVGVVKAVQRQADLLEVVLALGAAGRFAGDLNRGQQERD